MRTVVTGAAGFVGSALVGRLLSQGHHVVAVDNQRTGNATAHGDAAQERFRLITLDTQAPELTGVIAGVNPGVVFHLAARTDSRSSIEDPVLDARNNVLGTVNLCEACRRAGVPKIVYATTLDAYDVLDTPHAAAKRAGELYLSALAARYGIQSISLALATVYGPREICSGADDFVAALVASMVVGHPYVVPDDVERPREFVYIDDAVDALIYAGFHDGLTTMTYRVSTGDRVPPATLYELVAGVVHPGPQSCRNPLQNTDTAPLPTSPDVPDPLPGWAPRVGLLEGLARTTDWLRERRGVEMAG